MASRRCSSCCSSHVPTCRAAALRAWRGGWRSRSDTARRGRSEGLRAPLVEPRAGALCIASAVLVAIGDTALRAFFPLARRPHERQIGGVAGSTVCGRRRAIIPAVQIAINTRCVARRSRVITGAGRACAAHYAARARPGSARRQRLSLIRGQPLTGTGYDIQPIIVATVQLERRGCAAISDTWSNRHICQRTRSIPAVVSVGVARCAEFRGLTVSVAIRLTGPRAARRSR